MRALLGLSTDVRKSMSVLVGNSKASLIGNTRSRRGPLLAVNRVPRMPTGGGRA